MGIKQECCDGWDRSFHYIQGAVVEVALTGSDTDGGVETIRLCGDCLNKHDGVRSGFRNELKFLINSYSKGNESNTPDYILADYLSDCLWVFDKAVIRREKWYGRVEQFLEEEENG